MSTKKVRLNPRRVFSEAFKKARVEEYERGKYTVVELSKLYKLSRVSIYKWIYKYSTYNKQGVIVVEMKGSSKAKLKQYEQRIAELERALGKKQLKIDFLEKMIDLAEEEYNLSIKKNSDTPLSPGSKLIDSKGGIL